MNLTRDASRQSTPSALLATLAGDIRGAPGAAEAMRRCRDHILECGGWTLGRCARVSHEASGALRRGSEWQAPDAQRFAEFIRRSESIDSVNMHGQLIGRMLRERRPIWIADLTSLNATGRLPVAQRLGLRSAFAFPVPVHDEVAAFFEFFAEDVREPDPMLIEHAGSVASEIARLIEQEQDTAASARLAAIVRNSNDAIIGRTLDGMITSWNTGAERMLGYTATEAIGQSITFTVPPGAALRFKANTEQLLRGEPVTPYESRRLTKDGRIIDVMASHSPVKDSAGNVIGAATILQDISALKAAERALQASERRCSAIVQGSNDAIISRGLDGTILSWNAAAERMFGWSAEEAIGKPITIIVPPERRGEMKPMINRVLAGETINPFDSRHCRKDGARIDTSVSLAATRNAAGEIEFISFSYRDITDYKRLQREAHSKAELTRLLEALARAANEAERPEAALEVCLQRICEHGQWELGHAAVFGDGARMSQPILSIVRVGAAGQDADWKGLLVRNDYSTGGGRFAKKAITMQEPVWIGDLAATELGSRLSGLAARGMRRAFAFPVVANGKTLAILEFFAADARPADALLLENIAIVAAQLARLIERQRAFDRLRASEARVRAIFDSEPECVMVIRPEGSLIDINRAGLVVLEAENIEQMRTHGFLDFVMPEHRSRIADCLRECSGSDPCALEYELMGLKGARRWMQLRATPIQLPDDDEPALLAVSRDITEQKNAQERIDYLAHHDALTGLPNRSLFQDRLERAFAQARRRGEGLGVLMLNLDRFGKVNETLGSAAGDELLFAVAQRMRSALRSVDTIARFGGNEFAILIEGIGAADEVILVAEKINGTFEAAFAVDAQEVFLSASIGIAVYPNGASDPKVLLQHAERAMRELKTEGGNGYHLFDDEAKHDIVPHLDLERGLRHARDNDELELHYQPKVDIATGTIVGAEALVRWRHPELGMVSPATFIPIAEETGLILSIGEWVLKTACRDASAWRAAGLDLNVAVNLSPRQFRHKDLLGIVVEALDASGLDAEHLELEITETAALSHPERAESVVRMLRGLGVRIALDDFGTGHSSLSHLRRLSLDAVKIDRSFVRDIATNAQDRAIVSGVTALARSLGMRITAEGIEDGVQLEAVRRCGCDDYQGYHFSAPLPAAEFAALIKRSRAREIRRERASRTSAAVGHESPTDLATSHRYSRATTTD
jgi:diguanylate cyclase (GGDEF)-like protein/PAS domain S-box-containing protein